MAVLLAPACKSGGDEPLAPLPGSVPQTQCDSGEGGGGAGGARGSGAPAECYPAGPYRVSPGSVIANFALPGYARPAAGIGESHRLACAPETAPASCLTLGDFYNPSGDASYQAGDKFPEGEAKPKALLINISAVWCGPCKQEAARVFPGEYAALHPQGLEILVVLVDGENQGEAATWDNLDNWVTSFPVSYAAARDPDYQLGVLFDTSAYPVNVLVDARTMKIEEMVTGLPQEAFWGSVDEVLAR